jgi:hypothetical protein
MLIMQNLAYKHVNDMSESPAMWKEMKQGKSSVGRQVVYSIKILQQASHFTNFPAWQRHTQCTSTLTYDLIAMLRKQAQVK